MPLLWLSLAFLAGILLAARFVQPAGFWLLLAGLSFSLALLTRLVRRLFPGAATRFAFLAWATLSNNTTIGSSLHRLASKISALLPGVNPVKVSIFLLLAFTFLGAYRYQVDQPDFSDPAFIGSHTGSGEEVVVTGVLAEPPEVGDSSTRLVVQAEKMRTEAVLSSVDVHGKILATASSGANLKYGDRVLLRGILETPPEDELFPYRQYLAHRGIFAYMSPAKASFVESGASNPVLGIIYNLQARGLETVYRLWPDPEASLLAGILLGEDTGLPDDVKSAFQYTGTSHIIAISGFNITLISGLLVVLLSRLFGRHRRALIAILSGAGIAFYTLLVGADAAVVRAAIMGGLVLFAGQVGRRQDGLNSLAFTGALMGALNPGSLWDVGFQLSFMATLGLILYAEPLTQALQSLIANRWSPDVAGSISHPASEYFLYTLAAQVTTLPVMIYHFRRLSLVSTLANPAILPVQPAVMILGGLALILGMVYYPLGKLAAYLAWPFTAYTIRAVELFGKVKGGQFVTGSAGLLAMALFYAALLFLTLAGKRVRDWFFNRGGGEAGERQAALGGYLIFAFSGLALLTVLVWKMALSSPDGLLHLVILPGGGGDAILIQAPSGGSVLINGGAGARYLSDALGSQLPFGERRVDFLVLANAGEKENITALPEVIERFPPGEVLWFGPRNATRTARDLKEALTGAGIEIDTAQSGQALELGNGAQLRVLVTGKRGAVFLLEWDRFRAILPLGANFDDLEALHDGKDIGPVTALLLAEQGYAPANPPEWIANLHPQVVLLDVDPGARQDLPSPEILGAIEGCTLLRTDQNGWIELSTDGENLWVEVERK